MADYTAFLQNLDLKQIESIGNAATEYRRSFAGRPQDERDAAFLAFRRFYYEAIRSIDERFWKTRFEGKNNDDVLAGVCNPPLKDELARNGIAVFMEDCLRLDESEDFLLVAFEPFVSESVQVFLALRRKELHERYQGDACLMIPFAQVAQRCIDWETYMKEYPRSPLKHDALTLYREYTACFLVGLDNQPVLDNWSKESGACLQAIRDAYEALINTYPDTRTGRLVAEYYPLLLKAAFKRTPEVDAFLAAHQDLFLPKGERLYHDSGALACR